MQGDEAEDSRILHASTSRPGSSSGNATGGSSTKLKIRFGGSKTGSTEPQTRHEPSVVNATNGSVPQQQQQNGAAESPMEMDLDTAGQAAAAMAQQKREEAIAEQQRKRQEEEAEAERKRIAAAAAAAEHEEEEKRQYDKSLQEIPQIARQHLVPVFEVARRAIARSYSELQSLVEVLPGQSDSDRKRSIIEYVIATRRQIVKLLVLLRWSKDNTSETERCINLIAFLQRQNYQLERAVNDLRGVRELLNGARVRNYDLATAVDVLSSGTYAGLPKDFTSAYIPPPKLTASDVLTLLQDLESVIRLRLQLYEHVPLQFMQRTYRIHDGRVTFVSPGLFKASFTLGGAERTDQWYLINFSFDLEGRDVRQEPSRPMRDHIVQACNEVLRKQAAEEAEAAVEPVKDDTDAQADVIVPSPQSPPNAKRGNALIGAYNLLQDLCLNYQLELLHYHAVQTNSLPTIWQNRLAISLSKDRTNLTVQLLRSEKQKSPPGQISYFIEESLAITIIDDGDRQEGRKPGTASVAHLRRLADRLARASEFSTVTVAATSYAVISVQSKQIRGIYIRQPVFLDAKGKNVTPPAYMRLDMSKTEQPVELYGRYTLSSPKPRTMLEFDDILGSCFSASTGRLQQLPQVVPPVQR